MIAVFSDKYHDAAVAAANEFLADECKRLVSMSTVINPAGHYVLTIHYKQSELITG